MNMHFYENECLLQIYELFLFVLEFTPLSESDLQRLYTVPLPGTPFWGRQGCLLT